MLKKKRNSIASGLIALYPRAFDFSSHDGPPRYTLTGECIFGAYNECPVAGRCAAWRYNRECSSDAPRYIVPLTGVITRLFFVFLVFCPKCLLVPKNDELAILRSEMHYISTTRMNGFLIASSGDLILLNYWIAVRLRSILNQREYYGIEKFVFG